jgi:dihydropteroate synthase
VADPAGLMTVVNATPDSFSDGGDHLAPAAAAEAALAALREGADWIDLGGESTRPGAAPVDTASEIARVLPALAAIRAAGVRLPISVDTGKGAVAEAVLAAGASAINDVRAGADPRLLDACASARCPLVLMHMQGDPATMQASPCYADPVAEVAAFLAARMAAAVARGVRESAILLDPGIGFGKRPQDNLALLRGLPRLAALGRPLVVGVSRKSLIPALTGFDRPPAGRDGPSHALHALLAPHCALLRVHDTAGARASLRLALALAAPDATVGGAHG